MLLETISQRISKTDFDLVDRIAYRAFVQTTKMIHEANRRSDKEKGDPKIGGHPAACSSCIHILAALHLVVRQAGDHLCCKPHAAPADHSLQLQLGLYRDHAKGAWMEDEEAKKVMWRLRKFPEHAGQPVFQSYHAESDPDSINWLPSGSVGIPPVMSQYLALAYRYAEDHGLEVPKDAHFWSLVGDSEFREGSLMEAMPDAAERELGNVTWIIDYNRQNLDGTRIPNYRSMNGTDADRIERTAIANGWEVIQVRHGRLRRDAFKRRGGARLKSVLENQFSDYEYQMFLWRRRGDLSRARLLEFDPALKPLLADYSDDQVQAIFADLGGHDVQAMAEALLASRRDTTRPTIIIAHTVKGWGLEMYAAPGNHSALPGDEEMKRLIGQAGVTEDDPFALFPADSPEGQYLAGRRTELREGIEAQLVLRDRNHEKVVQEMKQAGSSIPESLEIDLTMFPMVHTQWMWGQLAAKLVRLGNEQEGNKPGAPSLSDRDKMWATMADLILTMAPDVGTSTNVNPSMNEKIYGPSPSAVLRDTLVIKETGRPDLNPSEAAWTRHIRFEIAEANCMSAAGSFGKMGHHVGMPFLPMMTVYDFFIKRALDQFFYNLYYKAGFICVGTPSGVTLSPEGAQHSWKSDIQIPNLVTWEPMYARELDWIMADTVGRHFTGDNEGRQGVLIRCVTRAIQQSELLQRLRRHKKYKTGLPEGTKLSMEEKPRAGAVREDLVETIPDKELMELLRKDVLAGGYRLIDYRGYDDYEPGDNVVHLFVMGSLGTEAIKASDRLYKEGIYANVIVVTSQDLLLGNFGHENGYEHLRKGLHITGDLHVSRFEVEGSLHRIANRRIPIVSACDGEPGLLDNIGSIVGVKQVPLAVRHFSKCGRPSEVFAYQHIDHEAVYQAAHRVLRFAADEGGRIR